jgi:nitrogen regulatory protein PII
VYKNRWQRQITKDDFKEELYKAEVNLITVSEVLGHGRQKGVAEVYRGFKETGNLLRKIRLEIAVNDNFVEPTVKAIIKGARTGETGDGKILFCRSNNATESEPEKRDRWQSGKYIFVKH